MAQYDEEFDKIILAEGGYIDDKDDAGGETYLGISRKNNPRWDGWISIDQLKKHHPKDFKKYLKQTPELIDKAKRLYKEKYWDVMELDDIPSQGIAHQLFDTAVNMGVACAIRIAQNILMMTITGKWSEELKYNLMQYGKKNELLIMMFMFLIGCCIGIYIAFHFDLIKDNHKVNNIIISDTTYNKVILDSIEYNIIKKDSIIYKLKEEVSYEIEKALDANDSIAVKQFKSLSTAK